MITYHGLASVGGADCSIGVDDQDSTVKHARVNMVDAFRDVALTFYDEPNHVVFYRVFTERGVVVDVPLDESAWVPYSTEMMQVPATGEWVEVMNAPRFMFG